MLSNPVKTGKDADETENDESEGIRDEEDSDRFRKRSIIWALGPNNG